MHTALNRIYRLIWSRRWLTWVAVSEVGRGCVGGASLAPRLALALLLCSGAQAAAPAPSQLPTGGQVAAGSATISQSGARMDVLQTSPRAIINWNTFDVGAQAQVNFRQPSTESVILNRVLDTQPSQIAGRITANGQVFLINPSGVYFSKGASVDVGGLVATTHSISDADFLAGRNFFSRSGATGAVVNEGSLTAASGGYIALLAPEVRNQGVVVARMGTVAMAAGETISLQFDQGLAGVLATPSQIQALVDNQWAVQAPGGKIILSAKAADRLLGGVVKNSGSLEATGITDRGGRIVLEASDQIIHTGTIRADAAPTSAGHGGFVSLIADLSNPASLARINGSVSARAGDQGGDGGFIETSGSHLEVGAATRVDTSAPRGQSGSWLLDPNNFTIAAALGNMTGATIATNLETTDVLIDTTIQGSVGNGDIFVNDSIAKVAGADHSLTLKATRNISLAGNVAITSSAGRLNVVLAADSDSVGGGGITLNSGSSIRSNGGNVVLGGGTCTTSSCTGAAQGVAAGNSGISLSGTAASPITIATAGGSIWMYGRGNAGGAWGLSLLNASVDSGATGSINLRGDGYYGGGNNGFGIYLSRATVRGGSGGALLTGSGNTGASLAAQYSYPLALGSGTNLDTPDNTYVYTTNGGTLSINLTSAQGAANRSNWYFGETAGGLGHATLQNGDISISITGTETVTPSLPNIRIPSGNLSFTSHRGISNAFTCPWGGACSVGSSQTVAGTTTIVAGGAAYDVTLGNVPGNGGPTADFGGALSISNVRNLSIQDANALTLGTLSASGTISALSGAASDLSIAASGSVSTSSTAINAVVLASGKDFINAKGLGAINLTGGGSSRWLVYSSAPASDTFGSLASGNLALWGKTYGAYGPGSVTETGNRYLFSTQPALTVTAANGSKTYGQALNLASPVAGTDYILSGLVNAATYGSVFSQDSYTGAPALSSTGAPATANVAGSPYAITPTVGTLAAPTGYGANSYVNGALTVSRAPLTVTANAATKTYDSLAYSGGNGIAYAGFVNGETSAVLGGAPAYGGTSQGAINAGSYVLTPSGLTSGNYQISYVNGALTVSKAPLTLSTMDVTKTYDGTTNAAGQARVVSGQLYGADSLSGGRFAFADPGVGSNKTVHVAGVTVSDGNGGQNYAITLADNTSSTILPATVPPPPPLSALLSGRPIRLGSLLALDSGTLVMAPPEVSAPAEAPTTLLGGSNPSASPPATPPSQAPATPAANSSTGASPASARGRPVVTARATGQAQARTAAGQARAGRTPGTGKSGATALARQSGAGRPPTNTMPGAPGRDARMPGYLPNGCDGLAIPCSPGDANAAVERGGVQAAVPGDPMAESFHEMPWLDNSSVGDTARSRASRDYSQSLESVNLMSIFTLFILP